MFSPFKPRAANAYQRVSVDSMQITDKHQIVSMLFDGVVQSIVLARGALARQNVPLKCEETSRAVRILQEGLMAGLDKQDGGELAQNLAALYEYCINRLALANARNDDAIYQEVQRLIEPLAQSWKDIQRKPEGRGQADAPAEGAGGPDLTAFAAQVFNGRASLYSRMSMAGV